MKKLRILASILCAFSSHINGASLVINGDFESGNTVFSSQYSYAPASNTTEGEYTVRTDPENWNNLFAATPDHTSGVGNMLVVNGATTGNPYFWQEIVPVSSFTGYDFSAWISTAVAGGPADLYVEINGVLVGSLFTAPDLPGTWENWSEQWMSGSATMADIRIYNSDTSTFPNDFYVDDISFMAAVPIPAAAWLFGSGLLGLVGVAMRKAT
ncbi:MAG: hypothetical protein ABFS24_04010 [Pseudomonadota bacterium]